MPSLAPARPAQRALLLALALFTFFVVAAAGAERASACVTQPFSPAPLANSFEGADGDQCDSDGLGPKRDWQNVTSSPNFVSTTDAPSSADTLYGPNNAGLVGGSSDENVPDSWNFTIGNLGSSKFDGLAAYSFTDPLNNSLFLDLGFIRAAATGATFLAFELNQRQPGYRTDPNEVVPSQPFKVPTRTRGDLLVTYDVNNAGAIALGLCVWDGNEHTGRWEEFKQDLSGAPITNQPCPAISTTLYQAALNDAQGGRQGDIPAAENYIGTGQIDQGRFGEAVINLSDALKNPANPNGPQPCVDFGYMWMHTRSSDSLTSSQQDFILPSDPVSVANCSVEGRKFNDANANGADDGEPGLGGWTIFADYNGNGVLDNNKDGTFVNNMDGVVDPGEEEPYAVTSDGSDGFPVGHYKITDVQSGTWPIREELKPTWDCTAAIGAGAVAGCPERTDTNPDTALGFNLTWADNESFSGRDFGNHRQPATLRVIKHVVNDDGGTAAAPAWSLHVKNGGSDVAGSPQAGSETGSVYTLTDGQSYDVSETGGPSGYAATFSGDCNASGAVTVVAGTEKTCTITNNDVAPTVKVIKHVVNDDGGTAVASDWQLHLSSGGSDVAGSPKAGSETGDTYTVAAGTLHVSETGGPSGYAATYSGDCGADGNVTAAIGQSKTCTITNDDIAPKVRVVKHVINDNGGTSVAGDFTLTVDDPGTNPAGVAGNENGTDVTVDPGHYSVSETGPSGYAASPSADCDATIAIGETKTCTITNDDIAPTITVVKHVVNDDGGTASASDWQLHLATAGAEVAGSPKAGSETGDTYTVAAGTFNVSETGGPSGYHASIGDDCSTDGNVTVKIGETKLCTVTNDDIAPKVRVVKHVINDDGGTSVAGDFTLTVDDPGSNPAGVAGNENGTDVTVDPGHYSVSETGPTAGYKATYSADCDATIAVGETKTCTVTNDDIAPTIKVVKHVVNDDGGTASAGDWQLHLTAAGIDVAGSPQAGSETGDTYTVAAGSFAVSETAGPSGYAASFSGDCNTDGHLSVSVGDTKTCTITNNDIAPTIKVVKHVVNDDGGTASAADWQLHLSSGGSDVAGSPQAGSETGDTYTVSAGSFSVSETAGPSGYAASFSGDCNADGHLSVSVGQQKTCTVTNDDVAPTVKVVKHVVNDDGGTAVASDWQLHLSSGGSDVAGSPQPGSETGDTYTVAAGTLHVSETGGPSGYAASFGGDCNADGSVTVSVGQQKTCTVTNDDSAATITVIKHMVNDNGGTASSSDWQLHLRDGRADVAGSPQAGSETGDTYTVPAGAYTVSESDGPAGYAASYSGDCVQQGHLTVAIGEHKTCTVTNDDIAPRLTVIKHVVNKGGSTATASDFQMDVTAIDASQPHFPGSEQGVTITLDAGAYSVDESGGPTTFAKELSADCIGVIAIGTEKTCTITNTKVLPGGVVVKKGPAWAYHGDTLTFTFEVSNPGTTPLQDVVVSDDKCAPVSGPVQKLGGNDDAFLDAGETWIYTCSMTTPAHTAGDTSLVNTVTMTATDADGSPVSDTDQHTTRILHPAIAIDKTGPATAQAGQPVDYALVVTNPGDVPFLAANVNVSDALCESPPLLITTNGDATPGQLDPGDTWSYMCRVRTLVGQTQIVNVGVVSGKDSFGGHTVTDDDPATTDLTQPPAVLGSPPPVSGVLGTTASSGTARLSGPAKCAKGPFEVRVSGRSIAQVRFALDGRTIKTIKAIGGRTVFKVKINPRGGGSKVHRVTARVSFTSASATKARTLRYVYLRCPRQAVLPQFTG